MAAEDVGLSGEINHVWLALRYVGDEMLAAERTQFESLLAESQATREAVAEAVQLFAAVPLALRDTVLRNNVLQDNALQDNAFQYTAAGKLTTPAQPVQQRAFVQRPFVQRAVWAVIGAAACFFIILGVNAARHVSRPNDYSIGDQIPGVGDQATQASGDLALQWTTLAAQADSLGIESNPDSAAVQSGADEAAPSDVVSDDSSSDREVGDLADELATPSWLLAAISPPGVTPDVNRNSQNPPATE